MPDGFNNEGIFLIDGGLLDDYGIAFHSFAANHDALVYNLAEEWGVPDSIANIPTMPLTYMYTIAQQTINTVVDIDNKVNDKDNYVPFQHKDP